MQDNTVPSVPMRTRRCPVCKEDKPLSEFYESKGIVSGHCRSCTKAKSSQWYKDNREKYNVTRRKYEQKKYQTNAKFRAYVNNKTVKRYHRLKEVVFAAYGGANCVCCGETNPGFLTIDHVNNDGAQFRTRTGGGRHGATGRLFAFIIRNNFPADFQVLCYNCNCGKARNAGVCPHKNEGVEAIPSGSTLKRAEVHATLPVT